MKKELEWREDLVGKFKTFKQLLDFKYEKMLPMLQYSASQDFAENLLDQFYQSLTDTWSQSIPPRLKQTQVIQLESKEPQVRVKSQKLECLEKAVKGALSTKPSEGAADTQPPQGNLLEHI